MFLPGRRIFVPCLFQWSQWKNENIQYCYQKQKKYDCICIFYQFIPIGGPPFVYFIFKIHAIICLYWVLILFVLSIHCHTIFLKQEKSEIYTRYILSGTARKNYCRMHWAWYPIDRNSWLSTCLSAPCFVCGTWSDRHCM